MFLMNIDIKILKMNLKKGKANPKIYIMSK